MAEGDGGGAGGGGETCINKDAHTLMFPLSSPFPTSQATAMSSHLFSSHLISSQAAARPSSRAATPFEVCKPLLLLGEANRPNKSIPRLTGSDRPSPLVHPPPSHSHPTMSLPPSHHSTPLHRVPPGHPRSANQLHPPHQPAPCRVEGRCVRYHPA